MALVLWVVVGAGDDTGWVFRRGVLWGLGCVVILGDVLLW